MQRFGIDVVRYPLHSPLARTVKLLRHHRVDCVIDVGANDGGFGDRIRRLGYAGRLISFEPLSTPYEALRRRAGGDSNWETVNCAIGDTKGQVVVNVSGNDAQSSSVLPMFGRHIDAAPNSRYIAKAAVPQETLDNLVPRLGVGPGNRTFLKIDVQGYERSVLDGASRLCAESSMVGLQMELSLVPLYRGAMTYREAFDRAENLGLTLMSLDPVFADPQSGQLLQVDAVFFR